MANIVKKENGNMPVTFGTVVDQIFQNNLDRFFDDSFWDSRGQGSYQVPVNIRETDRSYELELVAPGLKKDDFQLNISNDNLIVSFEHKEEKNQEDRKQGWIRKEYSTRSFSKSFHLDDSVDANKIGAKYEDGVLHLSLPKNEKAQKVSRTIKIQ